MLSKRYESTEITDVSNTEQLLLYVRWLDASLVAHEDFIGMYELRNKEANTITEAIKDALLRLDLPLSKLRVQCYDMAALMAGSKSGVAIQLQTLQPKAIYMYVHCYGHPPPPSRCRIEFWPHWISTRGILIQRAVLRIQRIFHVELRPQRQGVIELRPLRRIKFGPPVELWPRVLIPRWIMTLGQNSTSKCDPGS